MNSKTLERQQQLGADLRQADYPSICVYELFEAQVERTPDAIALVVGGQELTYEKLNQRANQLAHYLQRLGVKADSLVGICVERSPEMIIGMLGILKAGGAYVPLDPAYPKERLEFMLTDAEVEVLLTSEGLTPLESADVAATVCLDRNWQIISNEATHNPVAAVQPHHLAYVIYTSGSTGQPKGGAMEHRSLVNLLWWHAQTRPASFGVTLQFCPISFDFSFHEIFSTLCFGGSLVLVSEAVRRNPFALAAFIRDNEIEKLFLPVTALQQLAEAVDSATIPASLREVITTGEQLQVTPAMVKLFRQTGAMLHNHYGATEFQDATTFTLSGDPADWPALPPIGRPLSNVQIHILDKLGQPVPHGEVGELHIGGAGVARGYLNRPELTKAGFIPNPFGAGRLYRTGDLARYRSDGTIENLGRADYQVKIRGIRIELGEIEAVLAKHTAVRENVVMAHGGGSAGNKRLVAYVVSRENSLSEQVLHRYLSERLPEYMLPEAFVMLDEMPQTPSGKINRRALPAPKTFRRTLASPVSMPESETEQLLADIWQDILNIEAVGIHDNFFDIGATSLLLIQVHKKLAEHFGSLPAVALFQYPTIHALAQHLNQQQVQHKRRVRQKLPKRKDERQDIAIIGMSGRFPGAEDIDAFWQNLRLGVESISFFTDEEIQQSDPFLLNDPNYVKAGAVLPHIDLFDASLFNINPKEAATMDPQQRLLLECAWEAFENAGYNPETYAGLVGVYAGSSISTYLLNNVSPNLGYSAHRPLIEADMLQFQIKLGNDRSYLPTRVSYKLNLKGPSVNVQTACSTALVAVHLARQSLLNGECDMALAGGISIIAPHKGGYLYEEGMIRSRDGHCRAFDAQAEGTLFGNGGGLVLLKRLDDALADGDDIVAVIKGSAVNNDGALKVGFTAPSFERQADVISDALEVSGVDSATITYVEAHGTGTKLGDPIEIAALTQAFQQSSQQQPARKYCALGSVKTNIGHLDEAAGIASLIKTALALKHKEIPPSLHFKQPNPQIDFENSPFYVNTNLSEWQTDGIPRRAGVSSFGMGGTNCHLVLEESPIMQDSHSPFERDRHLLTLSAQTTQALRELVQRYVGYLVTPEASLADMCFTANTGRKHFSHRAAFVAESKEQLRTQLKQFIDSGAHGQEVRKNRKIAFLFTGQGSQYVEMGRQLYETQPVFRETLERCDHILQPILNRSLLEILYPEPGQPSPINETAYTQPALFAVEYALYQLWKAWGIEPDVVIGHSVGEYVAACVAGVFSLEDGLKLIAGRGRLMQSLPRGGGMVSVMASERRVADLIWHYEGQVAIAAINGPQSVVISGQQAAIDTICATLESEGIKNKRLNVSHAFHSPLMEPMMDAFSQVAQEVTYSEPQVKLISNVTGQLTSLEACPKDTRINTAEYWVRHVRQPVRFAQGCGSLKHQGVDVFIEIGPKAVLLGMARECLPEQEAFWLPSVRPTNRDWQELLSSLREGYLAGVSVDWVGFDKGYIRRRVPLPTYPFQRERHWIEAESGQQQPTGKPAQSAVTTAPSQKIHPLLSEIIPLPASQEIRFQTRLDGNALTWLKEYQVMRTVTLPAAAGLEMVFAACAFLMPSASLRLSRVVVTQSLVSLQEAITLQIILKPVGSRTYAFQLISLEPHQSGLPAWQHAWQRHIEGELEIDVDVSPAVVDLNALLTRCNTELSPELLYQRYYTQQVDYGPSFRLLTHISCNGQDILAKIELTPEIAAARDEYQLHPILLEACLQTVYASTLNDKGRQTADLMLPRHFEEVILHSQTRPAQRNAQPRRSAHYWCHARQKDRYEWDFQLAGEDGQIVAEILGYQMQQISQTNLASQQVSQWLYQIEWETASLQSYSHDATRNKTGHWLLLAENELGLALSAQLQTLNHQVTLVTAGAAYDRLDDNRFIINPDSPSDLRRIIAHQGTESPYGGLLYLWGATADWMPSEIPQAAHRLCVGALHLVQALNQANLTIPLYFVTRGSQSVLGSENVNPAQAALWGMGRTLLWEQSELGCVCVDLDPAGTTMEVLAAQIVQTVQSFGHETQIAWRGEGTYVARLGAYQPKHNDDVSRKPPDASNGCYLLAGGLGGLGLKVAQYLVTKGARQLVLSARHDVSSEEARDAIQALEAAGAAVTVVAADVSKEEGVRAMLAACSLVSPLRGIIHLAGITDDGIVANQTAERFAQVMAPKVAGAWHLHQLTQQMPLDFFICFSSDSSLLGYASQTHYSAANAFLDALSHHRQARGLPSLTINWGPWGEVGLSSRVSDNYQHRMMMHGRYFLPVRLALQALDIVFAQPLPQVAVLPIDWNRWAQTLPLPHPWPFVENVAETTTAGTTAPSPATTPETTETFLTQILMMPVAERRSVLENHLRTLIGQVLGASTAQLGRDRGFFDYGMDSLTSIELRNQLQVGLDAKLPQMMAFTYPTIEALSNYLINDVLDIEFGPSSDEIDKDESASTATQTILADEISELSDAEAEDELLRELERLDQMG